MRFEGSAGKIVAASPRQHRRFKLAAGICLTAAAAQTQMMRMTVMLTQREKQLFDDLERQFYAGDARPARSGNSPGSSKSWVLEIAMGICVAMVAICGLLGSPEGVVAFTGTMMILAFMHYHF